MFSFATPAAFLLVLIALPIIGLYILKVRLRRIPVSTNLFWKQIYDEKPPRSLWQNLRHWISLLTQLVILTLLVLAITDPFFAWQKQQARRIVLVLDNSASMSATDDGETRLDVAKRKANQLLDGVRELDQVAILLADKSPQVLVGMTGHVPTLRRAVDSVTLSSKPTTILPAIHLSKRLIEDKTNGEIIIYSDALSNETEFDKTVQLTPATSVNSANNAQLTKSSGISEKATTAANIKWDIVGSPQNNIGITQFQTRRSFNDALGYELLIAVHNSSKVAIEARIELSLNNSPVDILPIRLQPNEKWQRSLEKTSMAGGILQASITNVSSPDGSNPQCNALTVDDVAFALLPSRAVKKVLLVTQGNLFLQKVFEANPLVELTVTDELPEKYPEGYLVVFHKLVPTKIPAGDVYLIDPQTDSDVCRVGGNLSDPIITEQSETSPLMRHIRMDNVIVPEARQLKFAEPVEVLAGCVSGDIVYGNVRRTSGRCLILNVNLESSDLAFRTAFPIMVSNALAWFSNQDGDYEPTIATNSVVQFDLGTADLDDTSQQLVLISPSGIESSIANPTAKSDRSIVPSKQAIGPMNEVGIWEVQKKANLSELAADTTNPDSVENTFTVHQFAVSLIDQNESDLNREPSIAAGNNHASIPSSVAFTRPIWFYLAMAGLAASLTEWFMYQRRVIA